MFYPPLIGYLIFAAVCLLLEVAIRKGRLARNRAIGIRSRHTMSSDAAWRRGHRAAVPTLTLMFVIALGSALALAGVELFAWPKTVGNVLAVMGWALIIGISVNAWSTANAAAKSADS